jgi:hypothetical protein
MHQAEEETPESVSEVASPEYIDATPASAGSDAPPQAPSPEETPDDIAAAESVSGDGSAAPLSETEDAVGEEAVDEQAVDATEADDEGVEAERNGSDEAGPETKLERRLKEMDRKLADADPTDRPEMISTLYDYIAGWPDSARERAEAIIKAYEA